MHPIINPGTPDEVKFNIFKRINTGGLVLEPQEIRHALNQGKLAKLVAELANYKEFKEATQYVVPSLRMLDREFVTRFVTFYINNSNDYKPDLDTFLNKSMGDINKLTEVEIERLKDNFKEAMILAKKYSDDLLLEKCLIKMKGENQLIKLCSKCGVFP